MANLAELVLNFIDANEKINFVELIKYFGIYFLVFWLFVSFWVFIDARKRYEKKIEAILIALFVFLFSFPGLIVYLILRNEFTKKDLLFLKETPFNFLEHQGDNLNQIKIQRNSPQSITFTINLKPHDENSMLFEYLVDSISPNNSTNEQLVENLKVEKISMAQENNLRPVVTEVTVTKKKFDLLSPFKSFSTRIIDVPSNMVRNTKENWTKLKNRKTLKKDSNISGFEEKKPESSVNPFSKNKTNKKFKKNRR